MASMKDLKDSSRELFTELLVAQQPGSELSPLPSKTTRFSWFANEQATDAALLSLRLSAVSETKKGVPAALGAALAVVGEERDVGDPELVRQGFALFVTHNDRGRSLIKPRTIRAAPGLFTAPRVKRAGRSLSIGGLAPTLDYWREDMLANEHHQHWHEVYPFTGRPPSSFGGWVATVSDADKVTLLNVMKPGGNWQSQVAGASATQVAGFFAGALDPAGRRLLLDNFFGQGPQGQQLPRALLRKILILNDRHGELFLYMHRQMLARYDAELLSHQLARVAPFKPSTWNQPIPEGYDPEGLTAGQRPFTTRRANRALPAQWAQQLRSLQSAVDDVLRTGMVPSVDGSEPDRPITANSLGEFVEEQLHNTGHGMIGGLSEPIPNGRPGAGSPNGVMNNPMAAIRDQVFWRWHKQIDNIGAQWQGTLAPATFNDAPATLIRDQLTGQPRPWASPDIVLVRTADLPANRTPAQLQQLGRVMFGGAMWDTEFTAAPAQSGNTSLTTVSELVTFVDSAALANGRTVKFLSHEPFTYFIRVENTSAQRLDVTARIFMVPSATAQDRRAWIEMDKFTSTLQPHERAVLCRSDRDSSVIKRPAETSPVAIDSRPASAEPSYCDCGWPYTLLLPRGMTSPGMQFRLMVVFTDATTDRVAQPGPCGSMSFCGARDRYPDTREMGYPFARPFAGTPATAIRDFILGLPSAAARTVTIRHTGP